MAGNRVSNWDLIELKRREQRRNDGLREPPGRRRLSSARSTCSMNNESAPVSFKTGRPQLQHLKDNQDNHLSSARQRKRAVGANERASSILGLLTGRQSSRHVLTLEASYQK